MNEIMTMGEMIVEIMRDRVDQPLSQPGVFKGPYPSGAPAIFIDTVARLGHKAALVGGVGQEISATACSAACAAMGWIARMSSKTTASPLAARSSCTAQTASASLSSISAIRPPCWLRLRMQRRWKG